MAIETFLRKNVEVRREDYAAEIKIRANPVDTLSGAITMEMHSLEYFNGEFERMDPKGNLGETVGSFAQRTFKINGKTITGVDVIHLIKQYVADLHAEQQTGE